MSKKRIVNVNLSGEFNKLMEQIVGEAPAGGVTAASGGSPDTTGGFEAKRVMKKRARGSKDSAPTALPPRGRR